MKALQMFSDEYLEKCRGMSAEAIVEFLEDFRSNFSKVKAVPPNQTVNVVSNEFTPSKNRLS